MTNAIFSCSLRSCGYMQAGKETTSKIPGNRLVSDAQQQGAAHTTSPQGESNLPHPPH